MFAWLRIGLAIAALGCLCGPQAAFAQEDPPHILRAKRLFYKGARLYKKQRYERALEVYDRAMALAPSVGAIHVNIARTHRVLGRCAESLLHYEAYLQLRPGAADRERIDEERLDCVGKTAAVSSLLLRPGSSESSRDAASEPPIRAVWVDHVFMGPPPWRAMKLPSGPHVLRVERSAGVLRSQPLDLPKGERLTLILRPDGAPASGSVRLDVSPVGAGVYLDGRRLGASPLEEAVKVSPGAHYVFVQGPSGEFEDQGRLVLVDGGAETRVKVDLQRRLAQIRVSMPSLGALLRIDGVETAPETDQTLLPGLHEIVVEGPGATRWSRTLRLRAGERREVKLEAGTKNGDVSQRSTKGLVLVAAGWVLLGVLFFLVGG